MVLLRFWSGSIGGELRAHLPESFIGFLRILASHPAVVGNAGPQRVLDLDDVGRDAPIGIALDHSAFILARRGFRVPVLHFG